VIKNLEKIELDYILSCQFFLNMLIINQKKDDPMITLLNLFIISSLVTQVKYNKNKIKNIFKLI